MSIARGVMNTVKLETLVIARAFTSKDATSAKAFAAVLQRFSPGTLTEGAWRQAIDAALDALRQRDVLDELNQLRDRDELERRIGHHAVKQWRPFADQILPALALGMAPGAPAQRKPLNKPNAWPAAIVAHALGLWTSGSPPSFSVLCDTLIWRQLGLAGRPKRCPAEVRAHFVRQHLATEPGPPDRLMRLLAAQILDAPRPDPGALRSALVRSWLLDRRLELRWAAQITAAPDAAASDAAATAEMAEPPRAFVDQVLRIARASRDGVFGDRKVFIATVWSSLRAMPPWSALELDDFKTRLVAAHRKQELVLARADLVAAMDPTLVASSETRTDGATFHFIVREPAR